MSLAVTTEADFETYLARYQQRANDQLKQLIAGLDPLAPNLLEAIDYSLFGNGKRVRPVLTYAAASAVGEITPLVDAAACAVECLHAYSLIHDDLPAMDNDELRRGAPTCHIAFDEATAILAGDALQALAFQCLARAGEAQPKIAVALVDQLAHAAGAGGMVGGQALDLAAVGRDLALPALENMHRHKTGALIRASVAMGATATGAASATLLQALDDYADAVGLAFQVQDDILDVVGETGTIGKQQGADAERDKPTYVSLLGLDEARRLAEDLHRKALAALAPFDARAEPLRQLSAYIVQRLR